MQFKVSDKVMHPVLGRGVVVGVTERDPILKCPCAQVLLDAEWEGHRLVKINAGPTASFTLCADAPTVADAPTITISKEEYRALQAVVEAAKTVDYIHAASVAPGVVQVSSDAVVTAKRRVAEALADLQRATR